MKVQDIKRVTLELPKDNNFYDMIANDDEWILVSRGYIIPEPNSVTKLNNIRIFNFEKVVSEHSIESNDKVNNLVLDIDK